MRQISYVLQLTGRATPQEGAATVLKATTTARFPACAATVLVMIV
jgi:hypothetical protein